MALEHTFNDYWWLAVPKIYDKELAIKRFIERFGRQPDEVREDHQLYWMGPASDMISTGGNETLDNVAD